MHYTKFVIVALAASVDFGVVALPVTKRDPGGFQSKLSHPAVVKANACASGLTWTGSACLGTASQFAPEHIAGHLTTAANVLNVVAGVTATAAAVGMSSHGTPAHHAESGHQATLEHPASRES